MVQNAVSSTTATGGQIPSFGTSFTYSDYGIQGGAGGQVVNAVVDNTGTVLNYSTKPFKKYPHTFLYIYRNIIFNTQY